MSRRLTGWVLTAAMIAAGPSSALSSNDLDQDLGREFQPTVTHVGAMPLLRDGTRSLAGNDRDYTDCLEVTPKEFALLQNGMVLHLESGLPTKGVEKSAPVDIYIPDRPEQGIVGEIARAKRGAADQAMPLGPLLIDRDLLPNGTVQADHIKAACGIPRGLTLLVPAVRSAGTSYSAIKPASAGVTFEAFSSIQY